MHSSYPKLNVLVVGGGIGGLTAAIALRRAGHSVTVYERASLSHEIGQGITIAPNGGRILKQLGFDFEAARMINYLGRDDESAETLEVQVRLRYDEMADGKSMEGAFGENMMTAYRVDLHRTLVDLAESEKGDGEPVRIETNTGVEDFDADAGTIRLSSGAVEKGDLVIAANGVKSLAAAHINGPNCPKIDSSGTIVYRFTLSREQILSDPLTANILNAGEEIGSFYISANQNCWLVRYGCRNDGLQNFALYCLRTNEDADRLELRLQTDKASLLEEMQGFHPALLRLAEMTTDVLPLWRCTTREPLAHLQRGKMVVIGDAAHPVKPHIGLGAVSSIEDAGTLGVLFRSIPENGDLQSHISSRLQLYEQLRKGRVAAYKYFSDVPYFGPAVEEQLHNVEKWMPNESIPQTNAALIPWLFSHDAIGEAERALEGSMLSNGR